MLRKYARKIVNKINKESGLKIGSKIKGAKGGLPIGIVSIFSSALGIGNSASFFIDLLKKKGVPVEKMDISFFLGLSNEMDSFCDGFAEAKTIVTYLNPIEHIQILSRTHKLHPKKCKMIGYWHWETTKMPDNWKHGARIIDELWTPSEFVASSARELLGESVPVKVLPHILPDLSSIIPNKKRFGLRDEVINFACIFDIKSSITRKNVLGVIQAFKASGVGERGKAHLYLKINNAFFDLKVRNIIIEAVSDVKNVFLIEEIYSGDEVMSFIKSVDVIISLHRSEGYGLVLAEAMSMGVATIASNYSGNLEFMNEESSCLVDCKEVEVFDPFGQYDIGKWGEPNIEHCAEYIRMLTFDHDLREKIAKSGQEHFKSIYSSFNSKLDLIINT